MARLSPTKREALWKAEAVKAQAAGLGPHPICNIPGCHRPVQPTDAWDESHYPIAKEFGGTVTGVAHSRCNRLHGAQVVWPEVAKSNRVKRNHLGISGPGLGRHPMKAGRRSRFTRTFNHGLQPRLTHAEKHARLMAKRGILYAPEAALAPEPDVVPPAPGEDSYSVEDCATGELYGPFTRLAEALRCARAFAAYRIHDGAGRLVDWRDPPRPAIEQSAVAS